MPGTWNIVLFSPQSYRGSSGSSSRHPPVSTGPPFYHETFRGPQSGTLNWGGQRPHSSGYHPVSIPRDKRVQREADVDQFILPGSKSRGLWPALIDCWCIGQGGQHCPFGKSGKSNIGFGSPRSVERVGFLKTRKPAILYNRQNVCIEAMPSRLLALSTCLYLLLQ